MFIYNTNQNPQAPCHHILDPDYVYNTLSEKDLLYPYFKNLIKPQKVQIILGIYIEYQIENYSYQQYPSLYHKFTSAIIEKIKQYLDFGCANLYNSNENYFFITMFNVDESTILNAILLLIEDINQRHFEHKNKHHYFQMRSGLYFSHPYIDPYTFYDCSKEQFHNALSHDTYLSVKPYLLSL